MNHKTDVTRTQACKAEPTSPFSLPPPSLAMCEKALAEHLETKRLAFPRFYFVSSADLLDILSNGNDPMEVGGALISILQAPVSGESWARGGAPAGTQHLVWLWASPGRVFLLWNGHDARGLARHGV